MNDQPSLRRRVLVFLAVFGLAVLADQGTKAWARDLPTHPDGCTLEKLADRRCVGLPQPVISGYWEWELAMNDGAAFSNFRGGQLMLSAIAIGALILLGVMVVKTRPEEGVKRVALALIAGGALGNLIDRLSEGAVIDFVRWRIGEHRWPIFNVADVALVIGVLLLLCEGWLVRRRTPAAAAA
ncbi:MAG: signal peptidase II [Deltaproteobacteria bacterium]|nr:signal peptidase II [Deltaproteobacteria bacterium]